MPVHGIFGDDAFPICELVSVPCDSFHELFEPEGNQARVWVLVVGWYVVGSLCYLAEFPSEIVERSPDVCEAFDFPGLGGLDLASASACLCHVAGSFIWWWLWCSRQPAEIMPEQGCATAMLTMLTGHRMPIPTQATIRDRDTHLSRISHLLSTSLAASNSPRVARRSHSIARGSSGCSSTQSA